VPEIFSGTGIFVILLLQSNLSAANLHNTIEKQHISKKDM
jgi:hypothetical protein